MTADYGVQMPPNANGAEGATPEPGAANGEGTEPAVPPGE